tara:strand:- start:1487 stop:1825 length:339 start_codon:yes stop_codon:yes gene_type:complete
MDGHFWIEKDGEILDPHFKQYEIIAKINDCDASDKDYIEAPLLTQIWIAHYASEIKWSERGYGACFTNALEIQSKLGGRLVFGSMGFKNNNKPGYFYEYGGIDWKHASEFIK